MPLGLGSSGNIRRVVSSIGASAWSLHLRKPYSLGAGFWPRLGLLHVSVDSALMAWASGRSRMPPSVVLLDEPLHTVLGVETQVSRMVPHLVCYCSPSRDLIEF